MQAKNFLGTLNLLTLKIKNPNLRTIASRALPHFHKIVIQEDLLNQKIVDKKVLSGFQFAFLRATAKTAGFLGWFVYFTIFLSEIHIAVFGYQSYKDFKLSGETLKAAEAGELTLEKLLRLQPEVIFPYLEN